MTLQEIRNYINEHQTDLSNKIIVPRFIEVPSFPAKSLVQWSPDKKGVIETAPFGEELVADSSEILEEKLIQHILFSPKEDIPTIERSKGLDWSTEDFEEFINGNKTLPKFYLFVTPVEQFETTTFLGEQVTRQRLKYYVKVNKTIEKLKKHYVI